MIKVSVMYPNKPGRRFDVEYYLNIHIPLASILLGAAIKAITVEIGQSGATPEETAPFTAICGFTCETRKDFTDAFQAVAAQLQGDFPNYTDIEPIFQVSDVRIG